MVCIMVGVPNQAPPKTTSDRLKRLREDRGWTRQEVYDMLRDQYQDKVPTSTLEKWESGKAEPRASSLANLARVYNVTLDYLFLLSDEPDPKDA